MEDNESPKKKKEATTPGELRKKYEDIIAFGADHPTEIPKQLQELRKLILLEGMPPETDVSAIQQVYNWLYKFLF